MINTISKIFLAFLLVVLSANACTISDKGSKEETQGPEYTSEYVCPMHCEGSGASEEGTCPTCGMDYVLNENQK